MSLYLERPQFARLQVMDSEPCDSVQHHAIGKRYSALAPLGKRIFEVLHD
jgi:hypothetical protein